MKTPYLLLLLFVLSFPVQAYSASYQKASMLYEHGLIKESKTELIDVIFSNASDNEKAQAYYLLGSIAFDENRIDVALNSWDELADRYPNTQEAASVKGRIQEFADIAGEFQRETIDNAVAQSYLRNGDFWSGYKGIHLYIDSSKIKKVDTPNYKVDAANKWYDKVISEFPESVASRTAYEHKLGTLFGWGTYKGYGSKTLFGKDDFFKDMTKIVKTFNEFEKEHPQATTLQAFRYQIAQEYHRHKEWDSARKWLDKIIAVAGESDSFYKDLAQRLLYALER